jgi:histidine phosphotransfer protein HptB
MKERPMKMREMAENIGLDEQDFLELAGLFLDTSRGDLKQLKAASLSEDYPKVVSSAHSIKGASANLGFMDIYGIVKEVEAQAKNNSLDGAAEAIASIENLLDVLAVDLKARPGNGRI